MRTTSLFTRLQALAGSLLQRWRTARKERLHHLVLTQLTAATRRDLGLPASDLDHDLWPAARWTARHHMERYL